MYLYLKGLLPWNEAIIQTTLLHPHHGNIAKFLYMFHAQ